MNADNTRDYLIQVQAMIRRVQNMSTEVPTLEKKLVIRELVFPVSSGEEFNRRHQLWHSVGWDRSQLTHLMTSLLEFTVRHTIVSKIIDKYCLCWNLLSLPGDPPDMYTLEIARELYESEVENSLI